MRKESFYESDHRCGKHPRLRRPPCCSTALFQRHRRQQDLPHPRHLYTEQWPCALRLRRPLGWFRGLWRTGHHRIALHRRRPVLEPQFPLQFPDSAVFTGRGKATTIIDPLLVQAANGDVLCIVDANPSAVTTQDQMPGAGSGFLTINGTQRLMLTDRYPCASRCPSAESDEYAYYVGDFAADGFAPILHRSTHVPSGFSVDGWFNLYAAGGAPLLQSQVDSPLPIRQNVFYRDSCFHVYNTGYLCVLRSRDGGRSWEPPAIISGQVKRHRPEEPALLISPGRGLLTRTGRLIVPVYRSNLSEERAGFLYSDDNGFTWQRSPDMEGLESSESEMVEVNQGVLRMFFRNRTGFLCYADSTFDGSGFQTAPGVQTDCPICSTCKLSALTYTDSRTGCRYVLISCPGTKGRRDGVILAFALHKDNSMELKKRFAFHQGFFAYSCMTVLPDGDIGLLWEEADASIRFDRIPIRKILG